jgi:hypothetical protein
MTSAAIGDIFPVSTRSTMHSGGNRPAAELEHIALADRPRDMRDPEVVVSRECTRIGPPTFKVES